MSPDTIEYGTDGANLYEFLGELREAGPIHQAHLPNGIPIWLVTDYALARTTMNDVRLSCVTAAEALDRGALSADIRSAMSSHMMRADPPNHTRLTKLVSAAFAPRRIEALRPRVQEITNGYLDQLTIRQEADLIADYAFPIPIQVICELLGVPLADRDQFRDWSNSFVAGVGAPVFPAEDVTAFVHYLRELVAKKRAVPDEGLMSALITAQDNDDRLSDDEITSTVFIMIIAGHETTVNLIGNTIYLLLGEPHRAAGLRSDPSGTPVAIEETLRIRVRCRLRRCASRLRTLRWPVPPFTKANS